jgi:hypothetical protein
VEDHPVAEHRPFGLGEQLRHGRLDLHRVAQLGPAEPADQPPEVRVDGEPGHAEGVPSTTFAGLAADAGQLDEVLQRPARPAVPLHQRRAQPDQLLALFAEEAGGPDQRLELLAVGAGVVGRASGSGGTARASPR